MPVLLYCYCTCTLHPSFNYLVCVRVIQWVLALWTTKHGTCTCIDTENSSGVSQPSSLSGPDNYAWTCTDIHVHVHEPCTHVQILHVHVALVCLVFLISPLYLYSLSCLWTLDICRHIYSHVPPLCSVMYSYWPCVCVKSHLWACWLQLMSYYVYRLHQPCVTLNRFST